jgi:hypothetical protein
MGVAPGEGDGAPGEVDGLYAAPSGHRGRQCWCRMLDVTAVVECGLDALGRQTRSAEGDKEA